MKRKRVGADADCGIRGAFERVRERCVTAGIETALTHTRPKRKRPRVLDGAGEARLVQLACSAAPDGQEQWTLQLLADKLVIRGGRYFTRNGADDAQKNELKPWLKDAWCIPETSSAEFVSMEDTLEVYHRQQDPKRPAVLMKPVNS